MSALREGIPASRRTAPAVRREGGHLHVDELRLLRHQEQAPEFYKERVLKFLTKQEATFENILCNVPSTNSSTRCSSVRFPPSYVFGRDGKLAKRFDNEKAEKEEDNFTYDDVTKLVEELVKKK